MPSAALNSTLVWLGLCTKPDRSSETLSPIRTLEAVRLPNGAPLFSGSNMDSVAPFSRTTEPDKATVAGACTDNVAPSATSIPPASVLTAAVPLPNRKVPARIAVSPL